MTVLPTLAVIDSATGDMALRWAGSATVPQLERLLEDGERATQAVQSEAGIAALAQADRLAGANHHKEAAAAYRSALATVNASRRPRVIESLLAAQLNAEAFADCTRTALDEVPALGRGPSFANAVSLGLLCAQVVPAEAPGRAGTIAQLAALAEEALALPDVLADDRSGLYESLVQLEKERDNQTAVAALARRWLTFIEEQSAQAPTAVARSAFNAHRVTAAIALGDPGRALAAVRESEDELPDDFDPPYRRALVERALGHDTLALEALERAAARVRGPRRVRILEMRADIEEKQGDLAAVRRTLDAALDTATQLPPGQRNEWVIKRLRKRLAATTPR